MTKNKTDIYDFLDHLIANYLGTCDTSGFFAETENLSITDAEIVYSEIDVCSSCGWIISSDEFETSDDGELICSQCYEENAAYIEDE